MCIRDRYQRRVRESSTATMADDFPVVRVINKSEKSNPLLQRPKLGCTKTSTYNLPGNDYVYGKANAQDSEGCAEVLSTWHEHHANPDAVPGRDFMALNKRATISKMTTPAGAPSCAELSCAVLRCDGIQKGTRH
eukprot:TRINITY_DN2427_c0_g1_i2.p1 TRINITY_DN2427_c0_g1~~TRINITY_DN2427_c0_g1_i2.p1  ORF type:complete len:135 (+),score=42.82 TRINITY_DN2427_c0_g1_i2:134-538(+)